MNQDLQPPENTPPIQPPSNTGTPPGSTPAHLHQFTAFPVAVVIILHFMTCGLFSLIWINLLHGKLPKVRQDDPSAARALGFSFIPFFNLYWIFFSYRRLCLRIAEQRGLYDLPPGNLRGMATTNCIFQVIPYLNVLIGYTIITPIFLGMLQSSVNQLVKTSATTPPQRALPSTAAPTGGMSGGVIAIIVCCCCLPFIVGLLAALMLPALAAAQRKAQTINCVNNLKQVGLAFRIWEGDHNDQFPFNVSTNRGGTLELCNPGPNGLELNSWQHFQVMSNELSNPVILVCPADTSKQRALNFSEFDADHCTYLVHTGTNVNDSNPTEVLAICPFHRNVVYADGSVQVLNAQRFYDLTNALASH